MDEAHKELVKRLTATRTQRYLNWNDVTYPINPDGEEAARALEALAGEVERLTSDVDALGDNLEKAIAERDRLKAALETIAEEHDAGRHDGLPEPCPAHDADTMFYVARKALGDVS